MDQYQLGNYSACSLGIELGSTRIKAMLINETYEVLAKGSAQWESSFSGGYWTYSMQEVREGLQAAIADLQKSLKEKFSAPLKQVGVMGISAMMHGYLALDETYELLTPFRTWRNATTAEAAEALSSLFGCNIPQRWSIAHLEQARLNGEAHLKDVRHLTTLAGLVHYWLTGKNVLGVGDASGMFPIDPQTGTYNQTMLAQYAHRVKEDPLPRPLQELLPKVRMAGENAGTLTTEGALLLDPTGALQPGCPLAPPEGDAGTGMTATNAVRPLTGNVSAGTSIFAMVVLDKPLGSAHPELDVVTTPDGKETAMVHCNNGTADLNQWAYMIKGAFAAAGKELSDAELFTMLYKASTHGEADCGGTVVYNTIGAEPVMGLPYGAPMVLRRLDAGLSFPNFARALIYGCISALCLGLKILDGEGVRATRLTGHGGMFTTPGIAQRYLASALDAPVLCMASSDEGGAYGMALLGAFCLKKKPGQTLPDYLEQRVFAGQTATVEQPDEMIKQGFARYLENYLACLPAQKLAGEAMGGSK